jgi:hypothetical protein
MPRRDIYHPQIRKALENEGWTITADPMQFVWKEKPYYPDLSAERIIAAEKGTEKIAVEIKSFFSPDFNTQFYEAMGQYDSYFYALADLEPDRQVILAITEDAWNIFFSLPHVQRLCELKNIPIIVVDIENQNIVKWIK